MRGALLVQNTGSVSLIGQAVGSLWFVVPGVCEFVIGSKIGALSFASDWVRPIWSLYIGLYA